MLPEDAGWPKFIWTRWGTLVYCDDEGNLRHGDVLAVPKNAVISAEQHLILPDHHREQVELVDAGDGRLSFIRRGELFYTAEPDGGFSCTRSAGSFWERVILLKHDELNTIAAMRADDWVLPDGTIISARNIVCEPDFILSFASRRIDLAQPGGITITETSNDHIAELRFIYGGWQVASARRFRPLIYFAVFGPDHIFDMLQLCLTSIARHGAYGGHIFILSDRATEMMEPYVPVELRARTIFSFRDVTDHASMMMERFDLSNLPIGEFQPVLCLDADMVCDAPIMPLLAYSNRTAKFFGSAEYGGVAISRLSEDTGQWFGRFLFESAGVNLEDVYGLNGGAIAFPNKDYAAPIFHLIKIAFENSRPQFPDFSGCGEQPVLGYFLQTQALVDGRGLNRFIRFRNQNFSIDEAGKGFVHFNYGVGVNKLTEMSKYFDTLTLRGKPLLQNSQISLKLNRSIPGQMTDNELARVAYLASQVPPNGIIVEVGCLYGLSSWHIAQHCQPGVTLFCIDPWERVSWIVSLVEQPMNAPEFGRKAFEMFTSDCRNIVMVQGFSPSVAKGWNVPIDMYVEDAVHTNPELAENISFWSSKIKSGGIVCGHDYGNQFLDVPHEAHALAKQYNAQIELVDTFWSIRKP
jgi:hypothetical protein